MIIHFSDGVRREIKKLKIKNRPIFRKFEKQLALFLVNSNHPSLRKHKLGGDLDDAWSISIDMNYRALYYLQDGEVYFFKIGTHDEVYRMN